MVFVNGGGGKSRNGDIGMLARRVNAASFARHTVGNDDRGGARWFKSLGETIGIVGFVGIDENEIEEPVPSFTKIRSANRHVDIARRLMFARATSARTYNS